MAGSIAIIGASADRSKFGNKAVRAFQQGGWTVYPVHPSLEEVEGARCYASIDELPDQIDRVSMYVPPQVGRSMLSAIAEKAPKEFFLNPGTGDQELIEEAIALGLSPIEACSIVNIGLRPDLFPDE